MKVNVDINTKRIDRVFSQGNFDYARYVMANQMHKDMEPFIPMESGDLRDISHVDGNGKAIVYTMPYAAKQFYDKSLRHKYGYPHWDEVAKNLYGDDWAKVYRRGLLKK